MVQMPLCARWHKSTRPILSNFVSGSWSRCWHWPLKSDLNGQTTGLPSFLLNHHPVGFSDRSKQLSHKDYLINKTCLKKLWNVSFPIKQFSNPATLIKIQMISIIIPIFRILCNSNFCTGRVSFAWYNFDSLWIIHRRCCRTIKILLRI